MGFAAKRMADEHSCSEGAALCSTRHHVRGRIEEMRAIIAYETLSAVSVTCGSTAHSDEISFLKRLVLLICPTHLTGSSRINSKSMANYSYSTDFNK
jgi:hypothetical protein